jgi:hypothetical protein
MVIKSYDQLMEGLEDIPLAGLSELSWAALMFAIDWLEGNEDEVKDFFDSWCE